MPTSTHTDLFPRLLELCEEFRAQGDIGCEVTVEDCHTHFDEDVSEVVYRTVRELLTNVRQHAQATKVTVSSVSRRDGSVGITVSDNGIGMPPHRRRGSPFDESGSIGLWGIDQRLRAFDAVLDVEATAGAGTQATVILPPKLVVSG
jgi:signal transduction histidine kinase